LVVYKKLKLRLKILLGGLAFNINDLSKHDNTVTLHDGNTSETFTVLEGVNDEWLLRLENDFSHFVGLEVVRVFSLLVSGFLSDLPFDFGHLEGRASSTNESDRGVSRLQLSRVVKDLNLSGEFSSTSNGVIGFEDHDVTNTRHVFLDETLNVESDVVTSSCLRDRLVVHFDGENLSSARSRWGVGWDEDNFSSRGDNSLFDTSSNDVSYSLNLVDSRDRHAHSLVLNTRRDDDLFLENVENGVYVALLTSDGLNVNSVPPAHIGGFGDEIVSNPSRDRNDWDVVVNEVLLPADLDQHFLHFVLYFVVTSLTVFSDITVHLVNSNEELFDSEQVDEDGVLTGLSLDFSGLVVSTSDGSGEVTISRHHEKSDISLRGPSKHVLNEITMSRSVYNSVVLGWGEEFLGCASNGHTTFAFFLLAVHVEGKGERRLSKTISFFTELDHFTFRDSSKFEDEAPSGGGLASIDVSADYN